MGLISRVSSRTYRCSLDFRSTNFQYFKPVSDTPTTMSSDLAHRFELLDRIIIKFGSIPVKRRRKEKEWKQVFMTGYNETKGIGDPRLASLFNGFVASKSARTRLKTADKSKWPQELG